MTIVARRSYPKRMHVTVASPFLHTIELGASRQDHAMEISHEALRVFDSRRDCCYPRSASPCAKNSDCEIERGFESQRVRADVERRSNSKNVMPKQRSGATAIFSPRKRPCTATA